MSRVITIFSSREASMYINMLHLKLSHGITNRGLPFVCNTWENPTVFCTLGDTISALIEYANKAKRDGSYIICFFTPDDKATIRGKNYYVSRDNVWLEYGLFSAVLGLSNVFAIFPNTPITKNGEELEWHHPSDFAIQRRQYNYSEVPDDAELYITNVAHEILDIIDAQLPRDKQPSLDLTCKESYAFRPKT